MPYFNLVKTLALCTALLPVVSASQSERDLIFFGSCDRCGIFRRKVRFLDTDGSCKDRCVFFEGYYKRSGWECGECEGNTLSGGPFQPTIDLQDVPSRFRSAFISASNRWSRAIVGDLPEVAVPAELKEATSCKRIPDTVDDIFLCADVSPIDDVGGVLGQAGPELGRFVNGHVLPFAGLMQFDSADVENLVADGTFNSVILHEMGHVFGIGTIWGEDLEDLLGPDQCSYKFDTKASQEFRDLSLCTGSAVPLEPGEEAGTSCSHWAEFCLVDELMTGFASGSMPMSRITIGGLEDLGYDVDYSAADPFPRSQLSFYCDCSRRSLGAFNNNQAKSSSNSARRRELSEEGYNTAWDYGMKHLEKMRERKYVENGRLEDDQVFLADKVVVVYYMEAGEIHDVMVRADN